jgi:hypothetical protein
MIWRSRNFIACAALMLVSACTEVSYVQHPHSQAVTTAKEDDSFGRQVDFHLGRAFYEAPPACVMVVPAQIKNVPRHLTQTIEETVARHLVTRVDRIIDARRVVGEARARVYDPANLQDRQRLARTLGCDTYAEIDTDGVDSVFAVVWTDISVNIRLTLSRARDGQVIWRGRHRARRSDGGMPLTLLGVGAGTFAAGRLAGDTDALPSMIDDSVRRMMVSLPDVRKF